MAASKGVMAGERRGTPQYSVGCQLLALAALVRLTPAAHLLLGLSVLFLRVTLLRVARLGDALLLWVALWRMPVRRSVRLRLLRLAVLRLLRVSMRLLRLAVLLRVTLLCIPL